MAYRGGYEGALATHNQVSHSELIRRNEGKDAAAHRF